MVEFKTAKLGTQTQHLNSKCIKLYPNLKSEYQLSSTVDPPDDSKTELSKSSNFASSFECLSLVMDRTHESNHHHASIKSYCCSHEISR
jgi:hypothetical protein